MRQNKMAIRPIFEDLLEAAAGSARSSQSGFEPMEFGPTSRGPDRRVPGLIGRPGGIGIPVQATEAAAIDQPSELSATLERMPVTVSWQADQVPAVRFEEPSRLVHELLQSGIRTDEASSCRCPACSRLFVSNSSLPSDTALAVTSLEPGLTFKLHSNPNANHTIYLDFDGVSMASSQWENGGPLQVGGFYSSLTDPATQLAIQQIWRRVAEDFSPFNINVTTELPNSEDLKKSGTGDSRWGIRVAMTTNKNLLTNAAIKNAGGGGTAYLGSFNWATDEVCLVFNGYNGTDAGSIYAAAETVSHEVGHTLGLNHDGGSYGSNLDYYEGHGSGATSWGPIMGAPFINADENVTTWSNGAYIGANNLEDDLAIITGSAATSYTPSGNGFTYRVDDYGNSRDSAFMLSDITPSSFGIIERNTDIDWFRFSTGSGTVSLSISNACQVFSRNADGSFTTQYLSGIAPNLDISARLYDSTGLLIGTSNPLDQLGASFNQFLSAGEYYLSVEGVGFGTPLANPPSGYSDYGSLGQYLISGTLITPVPVPGLVIIPGSALSTSESGEQVSFTVALTTAPKDVVVVSVSSGDTSEGTVSPSSLTFTPDSWNTPQTVTVTGIDDVLFDGPQDYAVNLSSSSTDLDYENLTRSVSLTNRDNDLPFITILGPAQSLVEGQSTSVSYTVNLSDVSLAPISVAYATGPGTATAGTDYLASSGILSFAPGVSSQTITISLLNDSLNEADETFTLKLSAPVNAQLGSPDSITTTITDTLVAAATTVLPAGIENLRLDGNSSINGTGNSGANVITGNNAINVLKSGGGLDTLTGLGGTDSFDLTGISSSANRCTITDFITGASGETIRLSNNLTSRSGTLLSLRTIAQAASVTLDSINADLFVFDFLNGEGDVNLATSLNGTALLDGLNSASGSASLNTISKGGSGYIVAYDNDNAYLYRFAAGNNQNVSATEIALIGILDSSTAISPGALTSNNFALF